MKLNSSQQVWFMDFTIFDGKYCTTDWIQSWGWDWAHACLLRESANQSGVYSQLHSNADWLSFLIIFSKVACIARKLLRFENSAEKENNDEEIKIEIDDQSGILCQTLWQWKLKVLQNWSECPMKIESKFQEVIAASVNGKIPNAFNQSMSLPLAERWIKRANF